MIGLKRGTVALCDHQKEWEENAAETIKGLKEIFGDTDCDIQHVGSTAIRSIKAKPIIDIAVAVANFDEVTPLLPRLGKEGFTYRAWNDEPGQLLFVCGDFENDTRTHHIHVVKADSMEWINYINFRDYLNANPIVARKYEAVKLDLMTEYPNERPAYTEGKAEFISYTLRKALVWSYLGKNITVKIDRPIGSVHPKHSDLIYPINYGYIEGVFGGDGEELDVYVLGIDKAVEVFFGKVIAIVHRENDVEDKLVAAPIGMKFTSEQISEAVQFQEQYYKSRIEVCEKNLWNGKTQ